MLRAFATSHGADFDIDKAFINRKSALEARKKKEKAVDSSRQLGKSGLALHIFGAWDKSKWSMSLWKI